MDEWMNDVFNQETIPDLWNWIHAQGQQFASPFDIVTQALLIEFLELQVISRKFEALKERLKQALAANVPVEPGDHSATLFLQQTRPLTAAHIIEQLALQPETVDELRASSPPRVSRYLNVT